MYVCMYVVCMYVCMYVCMNERRGIASVRESLFKLRVSFVFTKIILD